MNHEPVACCPFCGEASMCRNKEGSYYCKGSCVGFAARAEELAKQCSEPSAGSIVSAGWATHSGNILDDLKKLRESAKVMVMQLELPDPEVVRNMLAAVAYGKKLEAEGGENGELTGACSQCDAKGETRFFVGSTGSRQKLCADCESDASMEE